MVQFRLRKLVLAFILPLLVICFWQYAASDPDMAGIVPTPLAVLQGWQSWIWGQAGLGLNPYLGTWASNVSYSGTRVIEGFTCAFLLGIPLGLMLGWSRLASELIVPFIK